VDAHGRLVTLRGVNAGGRSKFAPHVPFDFTDHDAALEDYLDRAQSWGIDVLRVPFNWAAMEPTRGTDDAEWLARYDALLDGAWERGMWTIVDKHQDIYSEVYCGDGFPAWTVTDPPDPHHDCPDWFLAYVTGDPDVDAAFDAFWSDATGVRTDFEAMWDRMVDRHADRPGVIGFELLNEPHRGTLDEATWGTSVYAPFVTDLAMRLQARDPDALIFFDGTGLDAIDQSPGFPRPDGTNLVFAPHFYDPAVFMGGEPDPDVVRAGIARWAAVGAEWDLPVLIGEMGADPDLEAGGAYAETLWTAVAEEGLHGTWWEYSVAEESWNGEDLSLVDADGVEATALVDALAQPYAPLLAGEALEIMRDGDVWTLAWTPADGVTELRWPSRLGAVFVEVEGGRSEVAGDRVYVVADEGADTVTVRLSRA
jgi:endoglycosylceramidase